MIDLDRVPAPIRDRFREDPSTWGPAVEEILRQLEGRPPLPDLVAPPPRPPAVRRGGRNATGRVLDPFAWVSTRDLLEDARSLVPDLVDVDAVVGVSRSGLLPATYLATWLHVPLFTVAHGSEVLDPGGGVRLEGVPRDGFRRVALVDDTAASGQEMRRLPPVVRDRFPGAEVRRVVVYAHPAAVESVDLFAVEYPGLHFLEWNWNNAGHGARCAYDFDGVLCEEIAESDCDYGERYSRALREVRPLFLTRRLSIPLVVTARPEAFRSISLDWLERHGIRVDRLVMRDWEFSGAWDGQAVARWKAEEFSRSDLPLFAESDPGQAETIRDRSGRTVICPPAGRVYPGIVTPTVDSDSLRRTLDLAKRVRRCPDRECLGCTRAKCRRFGRLVTREDCASCPELPE